MILLASLSFDLYMYIENLLKIQAAPETYHKLSLA